MVRQMPKPPPPPRPLSELAWSALPGLAALVLYLVQTPGVSGDKDGSEFTLALALGGVPHPTGYPLYTAVGHLFAVGLHALGASWPWAANAWSAVGGAVAITLLHACAVRLLPQTLLLGVRARRLVALIPVGLFALDPLWTYEAVLAEVYSWHLAWTAAACFCFLVLVDRLGGAVPGRKAVLLALGWGLLCGAGGAHHTTALFTAAPLSLALAWVAFRAQRPGKRPLLEAGAVLVGAALALASHGFVAWRAFHPAAWQWPALGPSWDSVGEHVLGSAYGGFLGVYAPSPEQRALLARYLHPLLAPALLLLALGTLSTPDPATRLRRGTLLAAAGVGTAFAFNYGVPDPSSYFLAPLALASIGGFASLWDLALLRRRALPVAAALGVGVLGVGVAWVDTGADRKAVMERFDQRVRAMWSDIPFDRAVVVWSSDLSTRLIEYQLLRGEKPGIEVVNPALLAQPLPRERFRLRHGFDPLEGVALPDSPAGLEAMGVSVAQAVNRRSPLPVVLFLPETESVRLLRKP